ncbi:winged helix-turn-helix domain-containing protein [Streptomyces microflavus]|uniref:helix-turn-helix domain-containing protein n=1 Tax=Streptomyces microflavus TaxID=1919 RepID=UPI0038243608
MPSTPALPRPSAEPVPDARQWISETTGRIAPDGYSWMQAVCWAYDDNSYRPGRGHGPQRIGQTTLRVAAELARLAPCRPGVAHLESALNLSRRTIQYHLGILREAGLLAYLSKGTRVPGIGGRASEFLWIIPAAFDSALHLLTRPCERYIRALRGIAEEGRVLMKRVSGMARKFMRSPRRARKRAQPRKRAAGPGRCTPMGGSAERLHAAGVTYPPSEAVLDRGASDSSTTKRSGRRRALNAVGRRFQLARELIEQVDWLRGCSAPRIAWVARTVADAGWTAEEVRAWLHLRGGSAHVRRPSGLLAVLLRNAAEVLDTPDKRTGAVNRWHGAVEAERRTRIDQVRARKERYDRDWQRPSSQAVHQLVDQALATNPEPVTEALPALRGPQELAEVDLRAMREAARADYLRGETDLITSAVEAFGLSVAEAMYGARLVTIALQLSRRTPLMTLT